MKMNKEVVMVKLSDIIPNRFQPRLTFDEEALNELADSIREHGIIQPLILRSLGDKFEIIAGERRYKASTMAGLTEVPALVGNMDDQTSAELALIENIQRKDLSAIEEAKSYKKILEMGNFTQEQLAKRMGKSQSTIANKMRLLSLSNEAQMALMNNLISERHARCLLQIKDENIQKDVLNKVISERMNVRKTDEYIKSILGIKVDETKNEQELSFDVPKEVETPVEPIIPLKEEIPKVTETVEIEDNSNNQPINPDIYAQNNNNDFINIYALNDSNNIKEKTTEIKDIKEEPPIVNNNSEKKSNELDMMTKLKFATAIRIAKDSVSEIEKAGYKVKFEEKNNEKDFQIIIKLEK